MTARNPKAPRAFMCPFVPGDKVRRKKEHRGGFWADAGMNDEVLTISAIEPHAGLRFKTHGVIGDFSYHYFDKVLPK